MNEVASLGASSEILSKGRPVVNTDKAVSSQINQAGIHQLLQTPHPPSTRHEHCQ